MKTKELIKLLQEEDPTGECHVRINGEDTALIGVVRKEGHWDGPYNYIKKGEDGKLVWVETTKNDKIDFITMDLFDLAEHYNGNWEEVKKTYYCRL